MVRICGTCSNRKRIIAIRRTFQEIGQERLGNRLVFKRDNSHLSIVPLLDRTHLSNRSDNQYDDIDPLCLLGTSGRVNRLSRRKLQDGTLCL